MKHLMDPNMSSMSWSIFLHLFFLFFKGWRNSGTVSLLVWRWSAVVGMSQGVESCTGISRNTSSTEGFNVYQWVQVANSFICDYSFYVGVLFLSSSQISLIVGVLCCLEAKKKKKFQEASAKKLSDSAAEPELCWTSPHERLCNHLIIR